MSSIKLDFLGLKKSPSKTAGSLDFTNFASMSSILITHPILIELKVCLMKLVAPWRRGIFQKSVGSCFSEIVETKKSGMCVLFCHSRSFSFHYA